MSEKSSPDSKIIITPILSRTSISLDKSHGPISIALTLFLTNCTTPITSFTPYSFLAADQDTMCFDSRYRLHNTDNEPLEGYFKTCENWGSSQLPINPGTDLMTVYPEKPTTIKNRSRTYVNQLAYFFGNVKTEEDVEAWYVKHRDPNKHPGKRMETRDERAERMFPPYK
ncbi:hypothetical protein NHQ30_011187 [Ciborinia camelliae]|nr:hypothetical protein NHQ30_011187 [Ciborinia camelliae]